MGLSGSPHTSSPRGSGPPFASTVRGSLAPARLRSRTRGRSRGQRRRFLEAAGQVLCNYITSFPCLVIKLAAT